MEAAAEGWGAEARRGVTGKGAGTGAVEAGVGGGATGIVEASVSRALWAQMLWRRAHKGGRRQRCVEVGAGKDEGAQESVGTWAGADAGDGTGARE
ncbi:unnamed protein product [Ilex paraguariensis]|uniref:Uncharacterized protein n=1 Tax=Ilex paraguariensis TaxID=185542 RepID=A0ABC8STP1_9AQUA